MTNIQELIRNNLINVKQRIVDAAQRSGRIDSDVSLVAITKYVDASTVRLLYECGCRQIGESRPQELWEKAATLDDLPIHWHLVGHLQRNKVRRTLESAEMIHSLDSVRLAKAIDQAAEQRNQPVDVLLEVNVSTEPSKGGFAPDELVAQVPEIQKHLNLNIRGLMCMAGLKSDDETRRREFISLRCLLEKLQTQLLEPKQFSELSMGMSGDYEIAIEEGATIVRVGSSLFEGML